MPSILGLIGWVTLLSLLTFLAFAWDKRRARRGGWRVSERTLLSLELLGGWPGASLAMRWLRHKSSKRSYRRRHHAIIAGHGLLLILLLLWWWTR
jgi:uncharacterized membrane protein YsdA (DUF1294 family)